MPDCDHVGSGAACPKCGRAMPLVSADDPGQGLCPKCLLTGLMQGAAGGSTGSGVLAGILAGALQQARVAVPGSLDMPRILGGYELIEEIARGGMGIVYRARQTAVGRTVAIKVLAAGQFASPDFIRRFRTEAEAVANLDHPNIVPTYEVGDHEGHPFFSMKFVEGGSLAARIASLGSPLALREAAVLLAKLGRAVHYAHQRGILHRDIKPGNVLLDAQGEPYLTDFGLAKLVEKDNTLTRTMTLLGTPSYMAPEQARGEARELTTAVDVYGLGALFYELLTGQPPFAGGTTMETVRQVLEKDPRPMSALRPGIDRDLETICRKCLEKDPTRRYASAEALAEDLERWQRHEPVSARPPSAVYVLKKLVRRNQGGTAALGTIALLLVVGVVFSSWQAGVQRSLRGQAEANERAAQEARQEAKAEAEQRRRQLVHLHVAAGNKLVDGGDAFMGLPRLVEALRLEQGNAAREEVHRRRFAAVLRTAPRLAQYWICPALANVRLTPDGRQVLCGDGHGGVQIFDAANGERLPCPIDQGTPMRYAWFTPDGKCLATLDPTGQLLHRRVDTGESIGPALPAKVAWTGGRNEVNSVDYSPDGRWVMVLLPLGVQVYDIATGARVGPMLAETSIVHRVRFSPDGRTVAITARRPTLRIYELPSGREILRSGDLTGDMPLVDFSPDSARAVTVSGAGNKDLNLWDIARGERVLPTIATGGVYADVQFSPDGNWIATAAPLFARVFDARLGKPVLQLLKHEGYINKIRFSPDGRRLATTSYDQTARVWDAATGKSAFPALPHAYVVEDVQFSRDGRRLLTTCGDGTVRLWQMPSGRGERLRIPAQAGRAPRFSPDGRHLLALSGQRVQIWETRSGNLLFAWDRPATILSASFHRDGSRVAVAVQDGSVHLWNVETKQELFSVRHTAAVTSVEFSPDGKTFLTASDDATARLWNTADGSSAAPALVHQGPVQSSSFSPDGRLVVTGSNDGVVCVWDPESGVMVRRVPTRHSIHLNAANLNADGRRLLTLSGGPSPMAQLWDATNGQPIGPAVRMLSSLRFPAAFSADGTRYLLLHDATSVAVMDAETGQLAAPLLRHNRVPSGFAFSPDGHMVLTCEGKEARIWETDSGEPVTPPLLDANELTDHCWSPDGREVVVGAADGSIQVWDVSPDFSSVSELQREAELLAAHRLDPKAGAVSLTPEEQQARWREMKR